MRSKIDQIKQSVLSVRNGTVGVDAIAADTRPVPLRARLLWRRCHLWLVFVHVTSLEFTRSVGKALHICHIMQQACKMFKLSMTGDRVAIQQLTALEMAMYTNSCILIYSCIHQNLNSVLTLVLTGFLPWSRVHIHSNPNHPHRAVLLPWSPWGNLLVSAIRNWVYSMKVLTRS